MSKFYVYVLKTVPEGIVFYVGKGSGDRLNWHAKVLRKPYTKEYSRNVYKRMRAFLQGRDLAAEKVYESENEIEALLQEQATIQRYGFDRLVNTQTHAFTGRKLKADAKAAMSKARREYVVRLQSETGHKMPPEVRAKISESSKGKHIPPEQVERQKTVWKSNSLNVDKAKKQAQRMCAMHAGKKRSLAYRAKLSAIRKGRPVTWGAALSRALMGRASRRNAKSKYRGVTWFERKKAWQCRIQQDGKTKMLGQFKLELDAAFVYDNAFEHLKGQRPNGTYPQHRVTRFKLGQHGKLIPVV